MSPIVSLEEVNEEELWKEIARRQAKQREKVCDFCGRLADTPPCRFPDRHASVTKINRVDPAEFRGRGYMQELNRRFLHPLGFAMEILHFDSGLEVFSGIWDYRDDLEGINYGEHTPEMSADMQAKAERINREWNERSTPRRAALGYVVQPIDKL